jgi:hypothetical protein
MNSHEITVTRTSGHYKGKTETFNQSSVSIGTSSGSEIRFDRRWDTQVEERHATIRFEGGKFFLIDHSRKGVWANGARVTEKEPLEPGVVIEVGQGGPCVRVDYDSPAVEPKPIGTAGGGNGPRQKSFPWAACFVAALVVALGVGAAFYFSNQEESDRGPGGGQTADGAAQDVAKDFPDSAEKPEFSISVDMGGQIFPSYLIAIATMDQARLPNADAPYRIGDPGGLIRVNFVSPSDDAKLKVSVGKNEIMNAGVEEFTLPEAGQSYAIYPKIAYNYDYLIGVKQAIPVSVSMSLSVNGSPESSQTVTVRMNSINDCPFGVADENGFPELFTWMFAAYVNENHPLSEEIRKDALASGIVSGFAGYQGSPDEVRNEVFAIWNVMQQRGIRYSNVTSSSSVNQSVFMQQVRFLDQSVNNSQANCVDGSVIFASVLRQIGIEPVLVIVPGHMFVGYFLDPEDPSSLEFLETTMMGAADFDEIASLADLKSSARQISLASRLSEPQIQKSLHSFNEALLSGMEQVEIHQDAIFNEIGLSGLIGIRKAREMGVMPIAYKP